MSEHDEFLTAFCQAVNAVKRITLTPDALKLDQYLGGDLGIDSVEMLEIWFRMYVDGMSVESVQEQIDEACLAVHHS